jgi:hypothetical protein
MILGDPVALRSTLLILDHSMRQPAGSFNCGPLFGNLDRPDPPKISGDHFKVSTGGNVNFM